MHHCSVVSFFVLVLVLVLLIVIAATGNYKGNSGVQYSAANYFL